MKKTLVLMSVAMIALGGIAVAQQKDETAGRRDGAPHPFEPRGLQYCAQPAVPIPDNCDDNPPCVTSDIVVDDEIALEDLNVTVNITHTFIGDLEFRLTSPSGPSAVLIWDQECGGEDDLDVEIDDEAGAVVCAQPLVGSFAAGEGEFLPLSTFDFTDTVGTWTLEVADTLGADLGTWNEWCLVPTGEIIPVELETFEIDKK